MILFGEQHHQPRVLGAELALVHMLASPPYNYRLTLLMEHFNLLQQPLLLSFSQSGDIENLQDEYRKSSEGFRLTPNGYLPLLQLARDMENVYSEIIAGFPPREWARLVMREGIGAAAKSEQIQDSDIFRGFDRWADLQVSNLHAAYIRSSISGQRLQIDETPKQEGLNAAQAFKDTVMGWKIDQHLAATEKRQVFPNESTSPQDELLLVICGSGHCEFGMGVTERIRNCKRNEILVLVTKPDDGYYWQDDEQDGASPEALLADAIIIYEAVDV